MYLPSSIHRGMPARLLEYSRAYTLCTDAQMALFGTSCGYLVYARGTVTFRQIGRRSGGKSFL